MLSSSRWFAAILLGLVCMSIFGCRVERREVVREEPRDREVIIERR
jgi:hypothetical protein